MQLLSKKEVKDNSDKNTKAAETRVRKLGLAERKAVKELNDTKAHTTAEKARLAADLKQHEVSVKKRKVELTKKLAPLEARDQKIREELEKDKKEIEKREKKVARDKIKLNEDKVLFIENRSDLEQEQDEQKTELDDREVKIKAVESELGTQAKSLNNKWILYHIQVDAQNAVFAKRESNVSYRENQVIDREQNSIVFIERKEKAVKRELNRARLLLEKIQ